MTSLRSLSVMALCMPFLAACPMESSHRPSEREEGQMKVPNTTQNPEIEAVPEDIRRLIVPPLPQAGVIHLLKSDKLILHPRSLICELTPAVAPAFQRYGISGIGIDGRLLAKRLKELGASDYIDGSPRQRAVESGSCPDSDLNIYYAGFVQENRDREPYRLVLVVWQDDRAWVGGIERSAKQLHPSAKALLGDIEHPDRTPPLEARVRASVQSDSRELSAMLVQSIIEGDAK